MLGHRSGVIGPRTRLHWADAADWDAVCTHIATADHIACRTVRRTSRTLWRRSPNSFAIIGAAAVTRPMPKIKKAM